MFKGILQTSKPERKANLNVIERRSINDSLTSLVSLRVENIPKTFCSAVEKQSDKKKQTHTIRFKSIPKVLIGGLDNSNSLLHRFVLDPKALVETTSTLRTVSA